MADIYDDDKTQQADKKSNKAWLIFGVGLLAAAGFGWQYLSAPGQLLGGAAPDTSPTSRPLSSGKISTASDTNNDASVTPGTAPALTSDASTAATNTASGSLKMTDLSTPVPAAATATADSIAKLEGKLAEKKAALASVNSKVAQADPAPPASKVAQVAVAPTATVQGTTPPLKMDKEFRSLLYAVFYRWASADLGPNARTTVTKLIPEALKGVKIVLTGRTDSSGNPGLNKLLAERRANAIKQAFVSKGVNAGIIESNINTSGDGKLNEGTVAPLLPKDSNSRARRVDIYIEAKDGNGGGMKPK